jgi:superfamily II DNA or RNA helicase
MKRPILTIIHNPVVAQLINPDRDARLMVSEILSYKVGDFATSSGFDGVTSMYSMRKNQFPAGFVRMVKLRMEKAGYKVMLRSKPRPEALGPERPVVDSFAIDEKYEYQYETVKRLVTMGGMIAQVATGGGKSRIFKIAAERINRPTLFVTTRKTLMYQMAASYAETINKPYGFIGDGKWAPYNKGVTFAIVDTLVSALQVVSLDQEMENAILRHNKQVDTKVKAALKAAKLPADYSNLDFVEGDAAKVTKAKCIKLAARVRDANQFDAESAAAKLKKKVVKQEKRRNEAMEYLSSVEFVTFEEAHEVSGEGFFDLAMALKNAHFRLALTATPFMKDDEQANMRLMAATGPIGIRITEKDLIDKGILAKPYFMFIPSSTTRGVHRATSFSVAYERNIVNHTERNRKAVKMCTVGKQYGLTTVLLVQRTEHGRKLEAMCKLAGLRARFISGEDEQSFRKAATDALGSGEADVVIGTSILDVGVDMPAVGQVGLVGGGKAEVAIRQRIGRGLRAKKKGPNVCFVFTFEDQGNNNLVKHSREVRRIIRETPGFVEGIVTQFDYSMFKRVA